MKNRGYQITGTIKSNRVPKNCILTDDKIFNKKQRGSFEISLGTTNDGRTISLARWKDKAVVTVASTLIDSGSSKTVKRWCKLEKAKISLPIPNTVHLYNSNMGGTDRMVQNINKFRIGIKGKKWWWSIVSWMIDASINNAWILSNSSVKVTPQKEFRRKIALYYLNKYGVPAKSAGRKSTIETEERYDGDSHFVQNVNGNERRRCVMSGCSSVGRTECSKCQVGSCIKCFLLCHTN